MSEESEMERIVPGAVNTGSDTGTLVEVKLQKKPKQTQKYLEAEPKALGVTQIMLSLFMLSAMKLNWNYYHFQTEATIAASLSLVNIIAGIVAIAAQNLHLPTLKACLGMQIVACVSSVICFMCSMDLTLDFFYSFLNSFFYYCRNTYHNGTSTTNICDRMMVIYEHITGLQMLVHLTHIALSGTLAAFCFKVIQCCSPTTSMPVVVVNAPPAPQ